MTPPGTCCRCGPSGWPPRDPRARAILAERDGTVVGLARTFLDEDSAGGAFPDNLHVACGLERQGIGTRLLALTARAVLDASPSSGLYLPGAAHIPEFAGNLIVTAD